MDLRRELRILEAVRISPLDLTLATVDLSFPALSDGRRQSLKDALIACAVPRWIDRRLLAHLTGLSNHRDSPKLLEHLEALSIVEPFEGKGFGFINVHESSRRTIRTALFEHDQEEFRRLSARSADFFRDRGHPSDSIEWIYHLLGADPEAGIQQLDRLRRSWGDEDRPEERAALTVALEELVSSNIIRGSAKVHALLAISWELGQRKVSTRQLDECLRELVETIELEASADDLLARAETEFLLGLGHHERKRLANAHARWQKSLEYSLDLVRRDPEHVAAQRQLARVHRAIGSIQLKRDNVGARSSFSKSYCILRGLLARGHQQTACQKELADTCLQLASALSAAGRVDEACKKAEEGLEISERLASRYPREPRWKNLESLLLRTYGLVREEHGQYQEAQRCLLNELSIERNLVLQRPTSSVYQWNLAETLLSLGRVARALGHESEAEPYLDEAREISSRLIALDPEEPGSLGLQETILRQKGELCASQRRFPEARKVLLEAVEVGRRLLVCDSDNTERPVALAETLNILGSILQVQGDGPGAIECFSDSIAVSVDVPGNAERRFGALSEAYLARGAALASSGETPRAKLDLQQYLRLRRESSGVEPVDPLRGALIETLNEMSAAFEGRGMLEVAALAMEEAVGYIRSALRGEPKNVHLKATYIRHVDQLTRILEADRKLERVDDLLRESLDVLEGVDADEDVDVVVGREFIRLASRIGVYRGRRQNLAEAERAFCISVRGCETRAERKPGDAGVKRSLPRELVRLGRVQARQQRPNDALLTFRRAELWAKKWLDEEPDQMDHRRVLALVLEEASAVHQELTQMTLAEVSLRGAAEIVRDLAEQYPEDLDQKSRLAVIQHQMGDLLSAQERYGEAQELYREALKLAEGLRHSGYDRSDLAEYMAVARRNLEKARRAHEDVESGIRKLKAPWESFPNLQKWGNTVRGGTVVSWILGKRSGKSK